MASEFTGRILHVNLTTGTVEVEFPPESFYRTYLGGSAMGLYYILAGMQPGTDGLDPANVMTVMDSLLTGAPIAGQSRITINARSPLTDGIGDSQGGGFFPAELHFAGFTGSSSRAAPPSLSTCGSTTARPSCGPLATCGAGRRRRPWTRSRPNSETRGSRSPRSARPARGSSGSPRSSTWPTAPTVAPAWAR